MIDGGKVFDLTDWKEHQAGYVRGEIRQIERSLSNNEQRLAYQGIFKSKSLRALKFSAPGDVCYADTRSWECGSPIRGKSLRMSRDSARCNSCVKFSLCSSAGSMVFSILQVLILHHGLVPVWIPSALLNLGMYSLYTSSPGTPRHPNFHNLRPPDRNR